MRAQDSKKLSTLNVGHNNIIIIILMGIHAIYPDCTCAKGKHMLHCDVVWKIIVY